MYLTRYIECILRGVDRLIEHRCEIIRAGHTITKEGETNKDRKLK